MLKKLSKKTKGILLLAAVVLLLAGGGLAAYKAYRVYVCDQKAILLAFDDYSGPIWEQYFDLFDEYGVKVTFFINAAEPTDFCYRAIERGHEIGYHGKSHVSLQGLSDEELYEQAIAPIEVFRENGIELTSFAYPYGGHDDRIYEELLQYYHTVRGAYHYDVKIKSDIPHCFIDSYPIDNAFFESDEDFADRITRLLDDFAAKDKRSVMSVYSHSIDEGAEWCVSPRRLEILFREAQKRNIRFCTFKQWQEPY